MEHALSYPSQRKRKRKSARADEEGLLAIACCRTSRVLWIDARLLRMRGTVIRSILSQRGRKDAAGHHPARGQNGRRFPTYPETIRNFPVPNVDFSNPTDKARHDE